MNTNGTHGHGEQELHLRDFLNLVRRNLGLIAVVAALVIGGTAWYTWRSAPVFESRATIHVEQDRPTAMPDLELLTNVLRGGNVETEMALLRARHIAEAVVDSLALQVRLERPHGIPRDSLFSFVSASEITEPAAYRLELRDGAYAVLDDDGGEVTTLVPGQAMVFNGLRLVVRPDPPGGELLPSLRLRVSSRFDAVQDLTQRLTVGRPFRDADLIAVGFQGTDAALVQAIPNTAATLFIAQRREAKKTEAISMVDFLNEQIATYSEQLQEAENAVLAFETGQQVVNLEAEGAAQVERLVRLQADRDELASELQTLTGILDEIERNPEGGDGRPSAFNRLAGFSTFLQNQAVTQLLTELNTFQNRLNDELQLRERTHPDVVVLERQIRQIESQLEELASSYRSNLQNQVASLDTRLASFGAELERIPQKEVQRQRLTRRKTTLETLFNQLQTRLKEAEIARAVEPGDVRISDLAIYPRDPIRPRKLRSLILATLLGLSLGLGLAALRDYLDETVHTREDLSRVTGLPVLALIPRIEGAANGNGRVSRTVKNRLVTRFDAHNPASEAYRAFRTNITFLDLERRAQVLVLTSPGPSEGKSTSAANLAITLAQQGKRVLLVDCDLRRGIVHKVFEGRKEPGLTNVLLGGASLEEAVHVVELEEGKALHVLSTGTLPPNPSELLGSTPMATVMKTLRERYDLVLLDSPPLNVVTDAAVLGTLADGVILIARAGATARESLRFATDQLRAVQAPVSGVVLNDVDLSGRDRYYGSGAGYRYTYRYDRVDA
ncbi:MAG: polysaccharide biosynthesis tyrosine autokinase [Gemmatimonadota bacterium]|nr:polysaccharide biosynthesis tyrosine autokinase [Gemmatimonadota bacterium]